MNMDLEPLTIEDVLDLIEKSTDDRDRVSLAMILEKLGRRSFGPVLLLAGLIILAPLIGDIPGVPTTMGLIVLLTAVQLLLRREHFWMPQWMLRRSMDKKKLCKGIRWLRPVARFLDRFTKPRLMPVTRDAGNYIIAIICIMIAAAIPPMEFVPFSANIAGASLTIFGLALTARDGLLALIAVLFLVIASGTAIYILQ